MEATMKVHHPTFPLHLEVQNRPKADFCVYRAEIKGEAEGWRDTWMKGKERRESGRHERGGDTVTL